MKNKDVRSLSEAGCLNRDKLKIGLMDSGMGGLSVLNELDNRLKSTAFVYYGDLKNSPYGNKSREQVVRLTEDAVDYLVAKGVQAVVIACNTATSVAIDGLRKKYSIPVFGMEPAIKPAALNHPESKIAVLATSLTLNEDKYLSLKKNLNLTDMVHHYACDGLATLIDRGDREGAEEFLLPILQKIEAEGIHAIVLGCTHYVFLNDFVRNKGFSIFDGNAGTAKHIIARLNPPAGSGKNSCELFLNTDNKTDYKIAESYLNKDLLKHYE